MSFVKKFNEYNIFHDPNNQLQPVDIESLFDDHPDADNLTEDIEVEWDEAQGVYVFKGTTYSPLSGYQGGDDQYAIFTGTATKAYPTVVHVKGTEYYGMEVDHHFDQTLSFEKLEDLEQFLLDLAC